MGGCIGSARDGGSLSGASSDFVGTGIYGKLIYVITNGGLVFLV